MTQQEEQLKLVQAMIYRGWKPFDERSIDLLSAVSKQLLADPEARRVPQYVALGYWLRRAAVMRLQDRLVDSDDSMIVAPRGVALHLPPTNVDTLFVYSWAISVLAGNCNIVRLPSIMSSDTQWLVNLVGSVIEENGQSDRHLFLQYDVGGALERSLASCADLRMIWGGDAKVLQANTVPIRPDGLSIGFPNRRSFAIISTTHYRAADEQARAQLVQNFFNDLYWFDQMGCGSPRVLFWLGEPGDLRSDFFDRLDNLARARGVEVPLGVAIAKLNEGMNLLAEDYATRFEHKSNRLDLVHLKEDQPKPISSQGGGFLAHRTIEALGDVVGYVDRTTQTITHFGLANAQLRDLALQLAGRGAYRLVPVGDALKFDPDWDGVRLFSHMTRVVTFAS